MSARTPEALLTDITESIKRIHLYIGTMTYAEFLKDTKTQDAVVRNIEIIGEAVKKLPESFTQANAAIPWKDMARTRDKLVHDYFGLNYDILWNIITEDLPKVLSTLKNLNSPQN
jgi:uncharacterized protein with HEPN domain